MYLVWGACAKRQRENWARGRFHNVTPVSINLFVFQFCLFTSLDHRLTDNFEFSINNILVNFYLIVTRSPCNVSDFFLFSSVFIFENLWKKMESRSTLSVSNCHFGFAFCFWPHILTCPFTSKFSINHISIISYCIFTMLLPNCSEFKAFLLIWTDFL